MITVPACIPLELQAGHFFYIAMANKPAFSIADQIALLKQRGMLFIDETTATRFFKQLEQ